MIKFVNGTLILALVVIPTTFGFLEMPTQMGLSIAGCSLALAFVNLDKFSKFKGAGFEAELKDAVNQAYAAAEELKELGLALTTPIVDTMTVSGRMLQYIHLRHKLVAANRIRTTLEKLGACVEEIDDVCGSLFHRVGADHYARIAHALKEANPDSGEVFSDIKDWDFTDWNKACVEKMIADHDLATNEDTSECIADLDYWLEHSTLRRDSKWQS